MPCNPLGMMRLAKLMIFSADPDTAVALRKLGKPPSQLRIYFTPAEFLLLLNDQDTPIALDHLALEDCTWSGQIYGDIPTPEAMRRLLDESEIGRLEIVFSEDPSLISRDLELWSGLCGEPSITENDRTSVRIFTYPPPKQTCAVGDS